MSTQHEDQEVDLQSIFELVLVGLDPKLEENQGFLKELSAKLVDFTDAWTANFESNPGEVEKVSAELQVWIDKNKPRQ